MSDDIPVGQPFSQAYLRPAEPLRDDQRFRRRLSALFDLVCSARSGARVGLAEFLQLRAGVMVPGGTGYFWPDFFEENSIEDILDSIGLIFEFMKGQEAQSWKNGVAEIFEQQGMAYRLDDGCAVRRLVDAEFDRTRLAAVAGLGQSKFKVAKGFFDSAIESLERTPPDTAGMVRNVFLANEEVFKLMFPAVDRLVAGTVRNHFQPERSVSTQSAITASQEMANSFAKWVAACQQYRHAPGEVRAGDENPAAPSLDLAIAMMSAGASYLRWLIALDRP